MSRLYPHSRSAFRPWLKLQVSEGPCSYKNTFIHDWHVGFCLSQGIFNRWQELQAVGDVPRLLVLLGVCRSSLPDIWKVRCIMQGLFKNTSMLDGMLGCREIVYLRGEKLSNLLNGNVWQKVDGTRIVGLSSGKTSLP